MIDIALVHYPVLNKIGEIIGSAVTNLDLHDIARAAKTFGVEDYYVITPYEDQQQLAHEIVDHWQTGHGSHSNPSRKSALGVISIVDSLESAIEQITTKRGQKPQIVTTSAQPQDNSLTFQQVRAQALTDEPLLILFGTAHGLAPEILEIADYTLPPIHGTTGYNHLSVRSAVSITLDRLLGVREENSI